CKHPSLDGPVDVAQATKMSTVVALLAWLDHISAHRHPQLPVIAFIKIRTDASRRAGARNATQKKAAVANADDGKRLDPPCPAPRIFREIRHTCSQRDTPGVSF